MCKALSELVCVLSRVWDLVQLHATIHEIPHAARIRAYVLRELKVSGLLPPIAKHLMYDRGVRIRKVERECYISQAERSDVPLNGWFLN